MILKQANRSLRLATPLGEDVLLLTAFRGEEAMSSLFRYELEMISDNNAIDAVQLVGKNVTFGTELPDGSPRWFNGFVSRFAAGDEDDEGRRAYRAEVVPWLWFLTRTSDCRIFQAKTVPDIIAQIFSDLGFSGYFDAAHVRDSHPQREYCVQYRETDFAFVSRLMEEEGIFYFFRHDNGKHTLVLADRSAAYEPCGEQQIDFPRDFNPRSIHAHLTAWEHGYHFRTGRWAQTDFNFKTPSNRLMTTEQTVLPLGDARRYEFYHYPGEYESTGDGQPLTKLRMEAEEAGYDVVEGASGCKSFSPGHTFQIRHHRSANEQGKSYVLTGVHHEAHETLAYETDAEPVEFDYRNQFTCIPDKVVFRPPGTTPRPVIQSVQTAIVTGPAGEEIYPDEYGRVKVQFHWDREGRYDENSSCWIRVSQIHAGQGWGAMDLPRVGEEVIVSFLEGDPDRPIITGRVYHAENMPPFALPGEKTRRGNTTKTYQGGGYNEMSMDDTPGKEQIRIHGQYDMDTRVENDETHSIGMNRTADVGVDETMQVGNNQSLMVGVNKTVQVGTNHTENVGVNQSVTVGANQSTSVGSNQSNTVGVMKNETVGAMSNEMVGAVKTTNVGAAYALTVGAAMNTAVGFVQYEEVGMNKSVTVGNKLTINAASKVEIVCGASKISMDSGGKITIEGSDILIKGSGKIVAKAAGDMVLKAAKIGEN